jgi:AcrR family transcriptional regulator
MPQPTFYRLDQAKRRRVIAATTKEFSAHPYERANLDRIAAAAGVPKGSLYQYFTNKRDLFDTAVGGVFQRAWEDFRAHLEAGGPPDCFEQFRRVLLFMPVFLRTRPASARLYFRIGFLESSPSLQKELVARNRAFQQAWFDRGIAEGSLDPGVDREAAGFVLDALIQRFHHFVLTNRLPPRAAPGLADALTGLLRQAVALKKEKPDVASTHDAVGSSRTPSVGKPAARRGAVRRARRKG